MEFANVYKIATRRDRDEVAASNMCSLLERFADTQILDFLVDAIEQLTEARPPEKTKDMIKINNTGSLPLRGILPVKKTNTTFSHLQPVRVDNKLITNS